MAGLLGAIALLIALYVGSAFLLDAYGRKAPPAGRFDAIVVAGCGVRPDGTPTPSLARRAERAVELWREDRAPVVLFTGGSVSHARTESDVAAAHAAALGLPEEAILREGQSRSTEENAQLARRLANELRPLDRVLVVTDSYHLFRTERVFRRHFPRVAGAGAISPLVPRVAGALREVVALGWYVATRRV